MTGLVHIYEGEGKGKTTAAVGLALRFAGNGGRVFFTQFLKTGDSSELGPFSEASNIKVIIPRRKFGFTFNMDSEQKREAADFYNAFFSWVTEYAAADGAQMLVLDEIMAADNAGLISHESLISFLKEKPDGLEVVLTGRKPADDLVEAADYVSRIDKVKHPYDRGVGARCGIER